MNISVVIVASGDHIDRYTNALKQIEVLRNQTVQPLEIIYVEQTLDGNLYYNKLPIQMNNGFYRYIALQYNDHKDLFSVSWCRNVGIYNAKGDVVLVLDCDYIFDEHYIEKLTQLQVDDIYVGWNTIYYTDDTMKTDCMQYSIFPLEMKNPRGISDRIYNLPYHDDQRKLITTPKDAHVGGLQIFNRQWFIDNLVGFSEDMFAWGKEDNDLYARAKALIKVKRVFEQTVFHLHHRQKQKQKLINQVVMERNVKNVANTHNAFKQVGLGSINSPHPIYKDSVKWGLL